jgi:hypothetical protein
VSRRAYVGKDVPLWGTIYAVNKRRGGSELSQDETAGSTLLHVQDTSEFDEEGGGLMLGRKSSSTAEKLTYDQVNDIAGTIHLTSAIADDWSEGAAVSIFPLTQERYAHVHLFDDESEVVMARVLHNLFHAVAPGIRDSDEYETVVLAHDGDEYIVTDLLEKDLDATATRFPPWQSVTAPPDGYIGTRIKLPKDWSALSLRATASPDPVAADVTLQLIDDDDDVIVEATIASGYDHGPVTAVRDERSFSFVEGVRMKVVDAGGYTGKILGWLMMDA